MKPAPDRGTEARVSPCRKHAEFLMAEIQVAIIKTRTLINSWGFINICGPDLSFKRRRLVFVAPALWFEKISLWPNLDRSISGTWAHRHSTPSQALQLRNLLNGLLVAHSCLLILELLFR